MSLKCIISLSAVSCSLAQFKCYSGECVSDVHPCTNTDSDSCSDGSNEEGCRKYTRTSCIKVYVAVYKN